jgi:hypothetical protein
MQRAGDHLTCCRTAQGPIMDNERVGIRATGEYAEYQGHEYFAHDMKDRLRLFSDADPLPRGFQGCTKDWVRGEAIIPKTSVEYQRRVLTTCRWHGHRFEVGIIVGDEANVIYLGRDFDELSSLPGLRRPDSRAEACSTTSHIPSLIWSTQVI